MLRTVIIAWLVLCTFGYGSVMAFDIHLNTPGQHEELDDTSNHLDSGGNQTGCDHCGHASAHTTGLSFEQPMVDVLRAEIGLSSYYANYFRLSLDPPDHPPRS